MPKRFFDRLSKLALLNLTLSVTLFFSSLSVSALAYTVPQTTEAKISWDHNDPQPEGYRIFQRKSGQDYDYDNPVWTGSDNAGVVYNLEFDTIYYFVVRAYGGDLESIDSEEVSFAASTPAPATYSITSTIDGFGSISPSEETTVTEGGDQTYTITPDSGYQIADVSVDGVSQGAVASYSFLNVDGNHSITATFETYPSVTENLDPTDSDTIEDLPSNLEGLGSGTISIRIEGEDGDLTWPMEIGDDVDASYGGYVWIPTDSQEDGGRAVYYFDIPEAGNYRIWGRQISKDSSQDSLLISIDDRDQTVWYTQKNHSGNWTWDVVSERAEDEIRNINDPKVYRLDKGEHKITIQQIENGIKLDQIYITNTHDYPLDKLNVNVSAFASSIESINHDSANAVDDELTTRWASAFSDAEWIYLDLGEKYRVSRVELNWETAYGAQYEIQVSNNALDWTTVYTEYDGDGGIDEINFPSAEARYVRMNGLKRGTNWGYSLYEFSVYGILSYPSVVDTSVMNVSAFASSIESINHDSANAVDDELTTRWASAFSDAEWIYLDLGGLYRVSRVELNWETAYGAQYEIQVSNNALDWTTVYTEYDGDGGIDEISFLSTEARYVRMNGLKRGTNWGYSLYEFSVYGILSYPSVDTSVMNVSAFASSIESINHDSANAVDDELTTRWASAFSDAEWIYLDLGEKYRVSRVELNWETAYGAQYEIQVSNNALDWTTVYTEYDGDGGIDEISFPSAEARYVRMNGLKRGTNWGYSLYEFKIY